ncbi:MAG: transcription elongation factor GreB [Burkholderiales bacterium]|nr:transcription elongation factor GreB [Burkholderiales bacterium]
MNKAFVREGEDQEEEPEDSPSPLPAGFRNYITPQGYSKLKEELTHLLDRERPEVVRTVAWAASNGDRSENADYHYGKKRLREIDRRIRFLTKRLEIAEVVDPEGRDSEQIFFGATVTVANSKREELTVSIVGVDEIDTTKGRVSWISPIARALLKAREGDFVTLDTPGGREELEVLEVRYARLD